MEKECRHCNIVKPFEEFHKDGKNKDGHSNKCKVCVKEYNDKRYKEKGEEIKAASREWYSNNSDKRKKTMLAYNKTIDGHYERYKDYYKQFQKDNLTYFKEYNNYRRRIKEMLPSNLEDIKEINEIHNKTCVLTGSTDVNIEHFIPISWGHGGTYKGNIYYLDAELNRRKKNSNPFKWVRRKNIKDRINIDKWNKLINQLARDNGLTVEEFKRFVYWCEQNKRTIEQIEQDGNKSSLELWKESLSLHRR